MSDDSRQSHRDPRDEAVTCTGKQRFESITDAQRAQRRLGRSVKGRIHHYRCNFCHGWHMGTLKRGHR